MKSSLVPGWMARPTCIGPPTRVVAASTRSMATRALAGMTVTPVLATVTRSAMHSVPPVLVVQVA